MQSRYIVSMPIKTVIRGSVEHVSSYGIVNGLRLANIRIRVESTTLIENNAGFSGAATYLDVEVLADDCNEAILQASSTARLFVRLMALVYQSEFEISLLGV